MQGSVNRHNINTLVCPQFIMIIVSASCVKVSTYQRSYAHELILKMIILPKFTRTVIILISPM